MVLLKKHLVLVECVLLLLISSTIVSVLCGPLNAASTLQESMDDIFGTHNSPNAAKFGEMDRDISSAKKYMMGLYKYINNTVECNMAECINKTNLSYTTTNNVLHDADTIVSFVHHPYVPRPNASDEEGSVYFDVQSNLNIDDTIKSELRVYLNVTQKTVTDTTLKLSVYQIIIPKISYTRLSTKLINASESSWHELDVLVASTVWNEDPSQNNGLLIVCETLDKVIQNFGDCGLVSSKKDYRPFLVSFYQSYENDEEEYLAEQQPAIENNVTISAKARTRRSLTDLLTRASSVLPGFHRRNKNDKSSCRKQPLYVTFKALEWSEWIIAPEGYQSYYCGGECKFPLHENMNATNHAIIQTLVHVMNPTRTHAPCCAPTRLEPLTVLFMDEEENVVLKKFANMIVNDCGCQ